MIKDSLKKKLVLWLKTMMNKTLFKNLNKNFKNKINSYVKKKCLNIYKNKILV